MGWEIKFLVNGNVCIYCNTMDRLMPEIFPSLEWFQEFYGYMSEEKGKIEPRAFTEKDYIEWLETIEVDEEYVLPNIYQTKYQHIGKLSFECLPKESQDFLKETCHYFTQIK